MKSDFGSSTPPTTEDSPVVVSPDDRRGHFHADGKIVPTPLYLEAQQAGSKRTRFTQAVKHIVALANKDEIISLIHEIEGPHRKSDHYSFSEDAPEEKKVSVILNRLLEGTLPPSIPMREVRDILQHLQSSANKIIHDPQKSATPEMSELMNLCRLALGNMHSMQHAIGHAAATIERG